MTFTVRIFLSACFMIGGIGCSSQKETIPPRPQEEPRIETPVDPPAEPPVNFNTNTDTVSSSQSVQRTDTVAMLRDPRAKFMVQIGAYKDVEKASQVQATAKERYPMPITNEYNPTLMLYQIRIGFFETHEAAAAFRDRMKREFPGDYQDSWVAELTQ